MANDENLTPPFPKGVSGNPKGRPRSPVLRDLIAVFGGPLAKKIWKNRVTGDGQERENASEVILSLSTEQTVKIANNKDAVSNQLKARAIAVLTDMKKGSTAAIEKAENIVCGPVVRRTELTGADGAPLFPAPQALTPDEAAELLQRLDREY